LVGKQLKNKNTGILFAFLTATGVGLIQYSHFGTYETVITFFTTLLFLACLKLLQRPDKFNLFLTALISGVLVSCKVTNVILLSVPFFILFINLFKKWRHSRLKDRLLNLAYTFSALLSYFLIVVCIFILTNPFTLWDFNSFLGSIRYESAVALGTETVFYTGEFFNTLPILYQIQHVFPFLITPFLMLFLLPAFVYIVIKSIIRPHYSNFLLLIIFLLLTLIPQAILFVKWTRYMVPVIPFFYCCIALFIIDGIEYLKRKLSYRHYVRLIWTGFTIGSSISCIYALAFLITAYIQPDTRIATAQYAKEHIPATAPIISEVYDLGITAFNPSFPNIKLFNFYDLDNNSPEANQSALQQNLQTSDYIILPSQRILKVRLQHAQIFPVGNAFYKQLLSNQTAFRKIYQTPCDVWCLITYSGSPVNSYEETVNVFDRPTLYIFKKE
jgi:4-amino-4-deoxy-L-arabinose transferase-like glycosyltransferase